MINKEGRFIQLDNQLFFITPMSLLTIKKVSTEVPL